MILIFNSPVVSSYVKIIFQIAMNNIQSFLIYLDEKIGKFVLKIEFNQWKNNK
jgi:hypothetical protein